MKSFSARAVVAVLATLAVLFIAGAAAKSRPTLQPDKLVILSTTDVKGKTSPCG